jgi:hypothetical protein
MTRCWEEDCHVLANVHSEVTRRACLTILQDQCRCLRVHSGHGALYDCIGRVLQRHRYRNADEAGRHACEPALGRVKSG